MSEEEMLKSMLRIYNTWRILRSISVGCMIGGLPGAIIFKPKPGLPPIMLYYTAFFAVLLAVSSYMMRRAWSRLIGVIP